MFGGLKKVSLKKYLTPTNFKILGSIVLAILVWPFIRKALQGTPKTLLEEVKQKFGAITQPTSTATEEQIIEYANDLAHAFGIHKSISKWSLRGSTEDDQRAFNILMKLDFETWKQVRKVYPQFTRTTSDLKNDTVEFLNNKLMYKLPKYMYQ
ncbi:hypothetical protein GCM10011340_32210 [Roseivirga thermotolerans]|uniref:DUF4129 domain-containing protein n=1 Tax=Roseivirga thermotolerans TaxID=1758176 RepID=A0ABQ3I9D3_9BACT|nr:hypothetical protein GCM10011340_32210 [Roseivirga thermotolerans]